MDSAKKDLMIIEYQEISNSMRTFMGIRLTILGFSVTVIGVIVTHIVSASSVQQFIYEACLVFVISALIHAISSLTRHMIVFSLRLSEIESEFQNQGFWSRWSSYLSKNRKDSKTRTIAIIVRALNILVLVFIIGLNIKYIQETSEFKMDVFAILYTFLIALISVYNIFQIQKKLRPKNYWEEISEEWSLTKTKKQL